MEEDIASALRSHGVSLGEAQDVLDKVKSNYSQFSVDLNDREAEHFLVIFKQVLYFAIFAHAPPVPEQVSTNFLAWAWVKQYTEKFLNAPVDSRWGLVEWRTSLTARLLPWVA